MTHGQQIIKKKVLYIGFNLSNPYFSSSGHGNGPSVSIRHGVSSWPPGRLSPSQEGLLHAVANGRNWYHFRIIRVGLLLIHENRTWKFSFICNVNNIRYHIAHLRLECPNSKSVIFQEKLLKILKCYNFLWLQRRHTCSPAASSANCVMTLYLLKVHPQTFLSTQITQNWQILSCDTLVANEWYLWNGLNFTNINRQFVTPGV